MKRVEKRYIEIPIIRKINQKKNVNLLVRVFNKKDNP